MPHWDEEFRRAGRVMLDISYNYCYTYKKFEVNYMRNLKTAISIPENIFLHAEETAKVLGLNRSRLYTAAIAEFLEKYREDNIKAKLNEIYTNEDSQVDPLLTKAQMVSLAKEDW